MPLPVLLLPPDQSSYAVQDGHQTVSTELDGGAGRYRADMQNASFKLNVQWTCDLTNFNYLKAFYRTAVAFGSLPFNIDLMVDSGGMQTYTAYFIPDTFQLQQQQGFTWVVVAQLEVLFNPAYMSGDAAIIAAGPDA